MRVLCAEERNELLEDVGAIGLEEGCPRTGTVSGEEGLGSANCAVVCRMIFYRSPGPLLPALGVKLTAGMDTWRIRRGEGERCTARARARDACIEWFPLYGVISVQCSGLPQWPQEPRSYHGMELQRRQMRHCRACQSLSGFTLNLLQSAASFPPITSQIQLSVLDQQVT